MTVYYIIYLIYSSISIKLQFINIIEKRLTWNDRDSAIWSSNIGVGKFFLSGPDNKYFAAL